MRRLLAIVGWRIEYVCEWGTYRSRYDAIDWHLSRPIHPHMSVAPPWAKMRIVRDHPPTNPKGVETQ